MSAEHAIEVESHFLSDGWTAVCSCGWRGREPQSCPLGCGRTTEDVYGGPCKHCWDDAPRGERL